jgi:hypothetical protein
MLPPIPQSPVPMSPFMVGIHGTFVMLSDFYTLIVLIVLSIAGDGDDLVQFDMSPEYIQNAPVTCDGGSGFNTFVVSLSFSSYL